MQSSKEQQGEIRKSSSVINPKSRANNRTGKTRDFFKKIGDAKEIFHAKMDTVKDRIGTDLSEAEDVKKRSKNTLKNYGRRFVTLYRR